MPNITKKANRVSARLFSHVTFGLTLLAVLAVPVTARKRQRAENPSYGLAGSCCSGAKPVDEAAAADKESEEALHHGDGVAAVVNDHPISNYDVVSAWQLFLATSGCAAVSRCTEGNPRTGPQAARNGTA